jgi:hypothetical protein
MDIILWVALGVVVLVAVSVGSGLIIRQTGRKQTGLPFYVAMFFALCVFGYGIIPFFALTGFAKAVAYGIGAGISALAAQYVFGEKIEQSSDSRPD